MCFLERAEVLGKQASFRAVGPTETQTMSHSVPAPQDYHFTWWYTLHRSFPSSQLKIKKHKKCKFSRKKWQKNIHWFVLQFKSTSSFPEVFSVFCQFHETAAIPVKTFNFTFNLTQQLCRLVVHAFPSLCDSQLPKARSVRPHCEIRIIMGFSQSISQCNFLHPGSGPMGF